MSELNLPKQYDPKDAQDRFYEFWVEKGYFHADPASARPAYCIVIPPPNVTGALHLGHALNNTLQDILIRWRRMQGYDVLWMPGTDHAGIATQAVVEKRLLEEEKKTRHDLGREALVAANLGLERRVREADLEPASADGLFLRLGADPVHPRRAVLARRPPHVLQPVQGGQDLSRQAADQLGHPAPHRRGRRRDLLRRGLRPSLDDQVPDRRLADRRGPAHRHHPARDHAGRHGRGRSSRRRRATST